ncbi:hypothetical protein CRYUN_Cryun04dG0154000 [Craigia yunnanensis]
MEVLGREISMKDQEIKGMNTKVTSLVAKAEHEVYVEKNQQCEEFGTVFVVAHDELFELRRKGAKLIKKIGFLEDENRKLFEQVESEKTTVEMLNMEIRKTKILTWHGLRNLFYQAKDEINILENEITKTNEAACDEIDHLSASLSTIQQEKDYIKEELDHLASKYKEIVGKVQQISLDKDHLSVSLATELIKNDYIQKELDDLTMMEDQEGIEDISSNLPMLIDRRIYDGELNDLSNQFRVTSQELFALKKEKDFLLNDFERSEKKSDLLREKLLMAIKKIKELVQDRKNLKFLLEEKNSKIVKLRLELQQEESMKKEGDQLEKFLFESNSILHRVVESIDRIVIPVDLTFQEPVEKLNLLVGYIDDCQTTKTQIEQELREVKKEVVSNMAGKLREAQATMKLLEDTLADTKNIEIELQKAIEEAHSQM